jgi:pimeloyl-ACP methyl ester carboxylesterase
MATYVLVSGAWHAGWCWERVVPELEAAGHRALAPNLAGMGPDRTPLSTITLAGWADQIANLIRVQDEPVFLVGHSRGGIVISDVAERVPDRIRSLVYLAAFLVPPGETLLTTSSKVSRDSGADVIIVNPDGTSTVRAEAVGPFFYNTTAVEWVERARSLLTAEPMVVFTTPLQLTAERFGAVRRAYIECTEDHAVPLALQKIMQVDLPCDPVFTLETDHSPFYSAPSQLAHCLIALNARSAEQLA